MSPDTSAVEATPVSMARPEEEDVKYKAPIWIGRKRSPQVPYSVQAKINRSLDEAKAASIATGSDVEPERFNIRYLIRAKTGNEVRVHKATDAPSRAQRRAQEKMMLKGARKGPNFQKPKKRRK